MNCQHAHGLTMQALRCSITGVIYHAKGSLAAECNFVLFFWQVRDTKFNKMLHSKSSSDAGAVQEKGH